MLNAQQFLSYLQKMLSLNLREVPTQVLCRVDTHRLGQVFEHLSSFVHPNLCCLIQHGSLRFIEFTNCAGVKNCAGVIFCAVVENICMDAKLWIRAFSWHP